MSENTSDPDRIERDLGETRARLDNRLTELQERLSPGQILDDLMHYFRGSEGAEFGRNLLESVKTSPLPAAVTGIGLAWLMASSQHPHREASAGFATTPSGSTRVRVSGSSGGPAQTTYNSVAERLRLAEQGVVRQQDETDEAYTTRLDEARGRVLGVARQAQETTEAFGQRVKDAVASAMQSVTQGASAATSAASQSVHDLRNRASDAMGQLSQHGQTAQDLGGRLASTLSDNPILLGALGLAAGALLGALVPQSREEEDALSGIAGQVRDTARSATQEAVNRGGRVAQAVADAGRQSASEHGLAGETSVGGLVDAALSGKLAGSAGEVARDALRAGDEAVRKEGLEPARGKSSPSSA